MSLSGSTVSVSVQFLRHGGVIIVENGGGGRTLCSVPASEAPRAVLAIAQVMYLKLPSTWDEMEWWFRFYFDGTADSRQLVV